MPRTTTTGLNVASYRRADGTIVRRYYDRETREFLGTDRDAALAAVAARRQAALAEAALPRSLNALIDEYLRTPRYRQLRPSTRTLYDIYLDQMRATWGDLPVRGIRPGTIERIKTQLQDHPAKANMILALFRLLLGLAVRLEWIPANPAQQPGRVELPPRTEIWSVEDETRFLDHARPSLRLAFLLLLYTVQRPADVLAMSRDAVSERNGRLYIALRQRKTGALLDVPVHARLETALRARIAACADESGPALLVASPRGKPWRYRNFARAWDNTLAKMDAALVEQFIESGMTEKDARAEVEARHRQRRDLRRTGIVRLAEAGATTPQIAAVSGHAIDYCQRIIDTYLPRRTEVALGGIEAWEKHAGTEPSKVVTIATARRRKG
ncbi:Tyrosine-type recombinase/integrase [Rhodovastum atsumiense]|uniref:Tyrosine-type recombinase/integrase n=1 Tax=Rhodovastum atsumiense TaxID=504468 RepID=A0A5M6IN23_9PROT|nr:tyrosine-type recombinase/integrase [Rhodovastum atsumiense]KAA5608948.1 tyrosine-type recombinase/integrase [Rhodovastum atsumiense]CAH2603708.1 Tyrosine-type recombinase/integrase [Rhodovastum atsumiense]